MIEFCKTIIISPYKYTECQRMIILNYWQVEHLGFGFIVGQMKHFEDLQLLEFMILVLFSTPHRSKCKSVIWSTNCLYNWKWKAWWTCALFQFSWTTSTTLAVWFLPGWWTGQRRWALLHFHVWVSRFKSLSLSLSFFPFFFFTAVCTDTAAFNHFQLHS